MYRQHLNLLFWIAMGVLSCKTTSYDGPYEDPFSQKSFTGYDEEGNEDSCVQSDEQGCVQQHVAFEERCKELGYHFFRCSCQKILCSFNIKATTQDNRSSIFQGYNRLGALLTCLPQTVNIACEPNTLLDPFKEKCQGAGGVIGVCTCNEVLCSLDVTNLENSEPSQE